MSPSATLTVVALSLALAPAVSVAKPPAKSVRAVRTSTPPKIDGRLDDAVWASAPAISGFSQFFPDELAPASQQTEARILYDDRFIYVGVRLFDDPDKIVARLTRRDREIETDIVAVGFDSRNDGTTGYVFRLSAAGVQEDGQFYDDANYARDWDAVWDGEVTIDDQGWSAEYRIPLTALRFSADKTQNWGFQVVRWRTHNKEVTGWLAWPASARGQVSRWGRLSGLVGLKPKRTFELRPFVVTRARATSDRGGFFGLGDDDDLGVGFDMGLDVKLGLTNNLTLDATFNPDFGQVEADQVVLNLSRFETFFPEKRPFFSEGIEVFQTPLRLFHSRRIGQPSARLGVGSSVISPTGQSLEVVEAKPTLRIFSALKATGNLTDRLSIGVLSALTGRETVRATDTAGNESTVRLTPLRNTSVLRMRYAFSGSSYVGVTATSLLRIGNDLYRAADNAENFAQSADAQWRSGDRETRITGQVAITERVGGTTHQTTDGKPCPDPTMDPGCTPIARQDGTRVGPGDVGAALLLQANRDTRLWSYGVDASVKSPHYDVNAVGFDQSFNEQQLVLRGQHHQSQATGALQSYGLSLEGQVARTFDNVVTRIGTGFGGNVTFKNFWSLSLNGGSSIPGQWHVAETGDGSRLERPPGLGGRLGFSSDSRKVIRGGAGVGGFVDYTGGQYAFSSDASVAVQLSQLELSLAPRISISPNNLRFYECTDSVGASCTVDTVNRDYLFARLDSASLSITARATYTFTPRLSLQAYAQLFFARGRFFDYTERSTVGRKPNIRFGGLTPSTFAGDSDGDGIKDDDFQNAAITGNVVLRWEFRPGSTLIAVATRSQTGSPSLMGGRPRLGGRGLRRGESEDLVLLKLTLFL